MYKNRFLFLVFQILAITAFAFQTVKPAYKLVSSGAVTCLLVEKDKLFVSNDAGRIEVFNWKSKKLLESFELPKIADFTGAKVPAKVICIDKLPGASKIVLVSQASNGFRNISIVSDGNIVTLISAEKEKLMIKKALFVTSDQILMATLANELILYSIDTKKIAFKKQLSSSVFSDFDLNDDKTKAVVTDESGIIKLVDLKSGNILKEFKGMNVDNIYMIQLKNSKIIGAGQDRRVSVYSINPGENNYYLESDFIVYCVGLNADGRYGAYSSSEENNITVFNTSTKEKLVVLAGQKSTLTQIKFAENNFIISASEDTEILVWNWK